MLFLVPLNHGPVSEPVKHEFVMPGTRQGKPASGE